MSLHVKKNDTVLVIAGKDKGKRGKVLRVDRSTSRAIVEKVNFIKKHMKANPGRNIKGGIAEREAPIHISNLMIVCGQCGDPVRVARTRLQDGRSARKCPKCGTTLS